MIADFVNSSIDDISHSPVENVRIIFFDEHDTMVAKWHYSIGNRHIVPCKADFIIDMALGCCAHSFVVLHNHPSGNCLPSEADVKFTEQLKTYSIEHGLRLVDHIVCAASGATSILASLKSNAVNVEPGTIKICEYVGFSRYHTDSLPTQNGMLRSRTPTFEALTQNVAHAGDKLQGTKR